MRIPDYFLGIDPSWNNFNYALVSWQKGEDGYSISAYGQLPFDVGVTNEDKDRDFSLKLSFIDEFIYNKIDDLVRDFRPIKFVCIEKPIFVNNGEAVMKLAFVTAIAFSASISHSLETRITNNTAWKKAIIGKGNIAKEGTKDFMVETYDLVLKKKEWDIYDSLAIAMYAGEVYRHRI